MDLSVYGPFLLQYCIPYCTDSSDAGNGLWPSPGPQRRNKTLQSLLNGFNSGASG